jgi:hypothetical protein
MTTHALVILMGCSSTNSSEVHLYRSADGFPDTVLPELEKLTERMINSRRALDMSRWAANLMEIGDYDFADCIPSDMSYLYYVCVMEGPPLRALISIHEIKILETKEIKPKAS